MTRTTLNSAVLATSEQAALVLDPLLSTAISTDSRVATLHTTGSTELRVPVVSEDAVAAWTHEGQEIIPSDVDIDELTIVPKKVAGLIPVSRELAEDSSPDAANIVGHSLSAALVYQMDKAFLGALAAPAPQGLGTVSGVQEISTDLSDLGGLSVAKTEIAVAGGTASVLIGHPRDVLRLSQIKEAEGSRRSLVEDENLIAGLPVIGSQHATEGELWVLDATAVHSVVREDVTVVSSSDALFSSDRVAVRATARVDYGFAHPQRLAKVTITT